MNQVSRRGDWMQTFGGRQFWPLDPRSDEVFIGDIAHALAQQCRYGGHTRRFYSVAEHCVLLARALPATHRLWALLHDASEAYLVDVPRPVKGDLGGYREIERCVMRVICERFGLPWCMPDAVHAADNRILVDEFAQAMAPMPVPIETTALAGVEPLGVTLRFWRPDEAEYWFLTEFDWLTGGAFAAKAAFHNSSHEQFSQKARRNG